MRSSATKSTFTVTVAPGVAARFGPASNVVKTAGIVRPVASPIMFTSPVRPGWPSFITMTALAPRGLRVEDLDVEAAGAALDERHAAAREAGEVRGLAAAAAASSPARTG